MKYKLRRANSNSDSLITTIPKWIVDKMNLRENDKVNIDLQMKKIIITKEEKANEKETK